MVREFLVSRIEVTTSSCNSVVRRGCVTDVSPHQWTTLEPSVFWHTFKNCSSYLLLNCSDDIHVLPAAKVILLTG